MVKAQRKVPNRLQYYDYNYIGDETDYEYEYIVSI